MAGAEAASADSEAEMTKKNIFDYGSEFAKAAANSASDWIWSLDTSDMTLVELEEYKKELQRLEDQGKKRRVRNVRLVIYAVVLAVLVIGIAMIPGTVKAQEGPVVLTLLGEYDGGQEEGPGDHNKNSIHRLNAHTFQLWFEEEVYEDEFFDFYAEDYTYRKITGTIRREPEPLNRQGKSSVTFSDGTTGAVWYDKRKSSGTVYLMVEYKMNVYGYDWGSLADYNRYMEKMNHD